MDKQKMKDNAQNEKIHDELLKEFKSYQDAQFEYLKRLCKEVSIANRVISDAHSPWYRKLWKKIVYIFHKYISYQ